MRNCGQQDFFGLFVSNIKHFVRRQPALLGNSHQRRSRPRKAIITVALGAVALFSAAGASAAPPPMLLPGQMDVSASGAFTYTVPITVPPGTAGMVPSLSLEYSSQSGDGIMGLGWSLAGLPSIGRCPRNIAQDAVKGSVNYDANDRFCMEGQRLVAISGTYGANNTEYRTEIEGFSKVVSYTTGGVTGTAWFKVWTKSGQIMEFGNTTDSRIMAQGTTTVRSWAVNKITDTKTNYLTVTYTNDTTNGVAYPNRMDYTGNSGASLSPYNSVRFTYNTNRPDQVALYHAGKLQKTTVLLTNVKTYEGTSNVVRDYQITYELGTTLRRSRVTQIKVCDNAANCLAPTTFSWQGTRDTITFTNVARPSSDKNYKLSPADFNGDGITDVFMQKPGLACPSAGSTSGVFLGDGAATPSFVQQPYIVDNVPTVPACFTAANGVAAADWNADGQSDLIVLNPSGSDSKHKPYTRTLFSGGWGFQSQSDIPVPVWAGGSAATLGDFNGDGRLDYALRSFAGSLGYPFFGNGNGTFTQGGTGIANLIGTARIGADFDGNGCSDILQQGYAFDIKFLCEPAVASLNVTNWTHANIRLTLGDFNGDGKTDILETNTNYAGGGLHLSTGTSLVTTGWVTPAPWGNYNIQAADFNGDGRTDLALMSMSGTAHTIWLSTGSGFVQAATFTSAAYNNTAISVTDWNNDGAADIWVNGSTLVGANAITLMNYVPETVSTVSNGLGIVTTVTYDRINKPSIYTKDTTATYPQADVIDSQYVVSRMDSANAIGGNYSWTYKYVGLKAQHQGRGFLGFRQRILTDLQTNIVETTTFRQDFPFTGLIASQTRVKGAVTLNSKTSTYASSSPGTGRYFVTLTQTVEAANDLNGAALPTATTTYQYDAFGNATQVGVSTPDGTSKVTNSTYSNDATNWILGRLLTANQTNTVSGVAATRQTSYAYNATSGLLTQEVVEPNTPADRLQTDYTHDAFGNRLTVTQSGTGIVTRTSSVAFSSRGQFVTTATNSLNHSATQAFDLRHGQVTTATDPNALVATSTYDAFGRPTLAVNPDSTRTGFAYAYCSGVNGGTATCPAFGAIVATATPLASNGTTQIGPIGKVYFDGMGREIAKDTQGFDGSTIRTVTEFDSFGRVLRISRPYFLSGGTPKWTTNTYDGLGRVVDVVQANGAHNTVTFNGLTVSSTNGLNQTTTSVKNNRGLVQSVTDSGGFVTSYTYDQFDNTKTITDHSGNVTTFTYDTRGRQTAANDPDTGLWQYSYNVLSELTSQTDAKNQTATLTYDKLGRMTQRVEVGVTSTWSYDTAVKGIGKLASDSASNGASHTFTYDSLSRPSTVATTVDGNTYTATTTYDANGRPNVITYPSGFAVRNEYTSLGYLHRLMNNATSTALWTANTANAELQITQQLAGNGVITNRAYNPNTGLTQTVQAGVSNAVANLSFVFNNIGTLTSRADAISSLTEDFTYDSLNRLTQYAIAGGSTKTVGYDPLGNITSKSDVGTYAYPTAGSARPHAIGSITGTVNTIFTYDANGNMIAGNGRTVTYTAFNMAASITQGSATVSFTYDANHGRIKQVAPEGTTLYIAGGIERFTATSGLTQWNDYLMAGSQLVGVHFTRSDSTQNTRHFVTDHLGSVAVITDEMGAVVERLSYDAWGKRRYANGADDSTNAITSQTTKGFTGHEHIASVGLINMNARIYDPQLGRFMTPDSVVQDIYLSQVLNRYCYVGNNPLSFTDPTGHLFGIDDIFIVVVAAIILSPIIKEIPIVGSLFIVGASIFCGPAQPACAAAASAAVTGVQGGDAGDILKSFALSYLQASALSAAGSAIGEGTAAADVAKRFVVHGTIGGTFSALRGGDFGSGFLSAGIASLGHGIDFEEDAYGAAFHAVLGGAGSVAGGGKFADGAITGAFGYLFNKKGGFKQKSEPESKGLLEPLLDTMLDVGSKAAAKASLLLTIATTLCGDDPRTCSEQPQYVIRGGIATAEQLLAGTSLTKWGLYGFSTTSAPGMTVDQLAAIARYPNGKISWTTVQDLASIGIQVVPTPILPGQPLHHTVVVPLQPITALAMKAISPQFRQKTNPAIGP